MPFFPKFNRSTKKQRKGTGRKGASLLFASKTKNNKEETRTVGGGFRSSLAHQNGTRIVHNDENDNCDTSTMAPCSESSSNLDTSWDSAGSHNFHKHSPLFVTPILSGKNKGPPVTPPRPVKGRLTRTGSDGASKVIKEDLDDDMAQLGQIMARDRQLPGTWYYSNNHILVNKERIKRSVPALTRRIELDALARERAQKMANEGTVQHGVPEDIRFQLHPCRRFGENVASGPSVRDIHKGMLRNTADVNNMVDRRYTYMGMGTAKSEDGTLYLCQIFKG